MNLCFIYNENGNYPYIKKLSASFDEFESIDLSQDLELDEYDVYLIDATNIDNEYKNNIKKNLKDKQYSLVYIYSNEQIVSSIYQFAFIFKAKAIITSKQDVVKVVANIKNNFKVFQNENINAYVGAFLEDSKMYLIHNRSVLHASPSMLSYFDTNDLKSLEEILKNEIDLKKICSLNASKVYTKYLQDKDIFRVINCICKNDEYFIELQDITKEDFEFIFSAEIASRMKFTTVLKTL